MPTKITIIGTDTAPATPKKPIEFSHVVCVGNHHDLIVRPTGAKPSDFEFIELTALGYLPSRGLDLMFAYNDPAHRGSGFAILGHWNDGVI